MRFNDALTASPGAVNSDIVRSFQASINLLGGKLDETGNYDAATSAAVLEFRGAAGLPQADVIDDDLVTAVGSEVDKVSKPATPSSKPPIRMDPIAIIGRVPARSKNMGLALLGIAALGLLFMARKKRGGFMGYRRSRRRR